MIDQMLYLTVLLGYFLAYGWASTVRVQLRDRFSDEGVFVQTAYLDFGEKVSDSAISVEHSRPFELSLEDVKVARRLIFDLEDGTTVNYDLRLMFKGRKTFTNDDELVFPYTVTEPKKKPRMKSKTKSEVESEGESGTETEMEAKTETVMEVQTETEVETKKNPRQSCRCNLF